MTNVPYAVKVCAEIYKTMVNFVHYLLVYAQQFMPSLAHLAPEAGTHAIWADTKTTNTDVFSTQGHHSYFPTGTYSQRFFAYIKASVGNVSQPIEVQQQLHHSHRDCYGCWFMAKK